MTDRCATHMNTGIGKDNNMSDVVENPDEHRFELIIEGSDEIAASYFRERGGRLVFTHTIVPPELEGRGIGSRLAKGILEALRASGRKAVLLCPFLAAYHERHPGYADVVADRDSSGAAR